MLRNRDLGESIDGPVASCRHSERLTQIREEYNHSFCVAWPNGEGYPACQIEKHSRRKALLRNVS